MFGNNKIKTDDVNVLLKQHERSYFIVSLIVAMIFDTLQFLYIRYLIGLLTNLMDMFILVFLLVPAIAVAVVAVLSLIRLIRQHIKIMCGKYDIIVATVSDRLGEYLRRTLMLYDENGHIFEAESSYLINKKIGNESKILYASIEGEKNRIVIPNCRVVMLSEGRQNAAALDDPTDAIKEIVRADTRRKRGHYLIADSLFFLLVIIELIVNFAAYITDSAASVIGLTLSIWILTTGLIVFVTFWLDVRVKQQIPIRITPCLGLGILTTTVIVADFFLGSVALLLWIASYIYMRRPVIKKMKDLYAGRYKVTQGTVIYNEAVIRSKYYSRVFTNVSRLEVGILGYHVFMEDGSHESASFGSGRNEFSYKVRATNSTIYEIYTTPFDFCKHPVGYEGLLIVRYDPYLQEDEPILF